MNREVGRGTDTLQQASSSNYLIYLFVFSASLVVLLPYLLPFGGSILRSSKKGNIKGSSPKASSSYSDTFSSLSSDFVVPKDYMLEDSQRDVQLRVVHLQRAIQNERERTVQLENEIRIMHISERYLRDRVQRLEDRDLEHRRSMSTSSAPVELLLQKTGNIQSRQSDLVAQVQELSRMLQDEKEISNALALEVQTLRLSKSVLEDRIKNLEDKVEAFLLRHG